MQSQSLQASRREGRGKGVARKLRAAAKIPAVVYGKGTTSEPVALDRKAFETLMKNGGHHGLIDLRLDTTSEALKALVREVQVHPVSRLVEHVDLQRVSMQERIRIDVPIVLLGKPEGVRLSGGILEHNLRSIEVECLPGDIPEKIEIDVTALAVGHSIHISDLKLGNVTILAHGDTAVATVSMPAAERSAEESAATAAAAATATAAAPGEAAAPAKDAKPGDKPAAKDAKGADKPAGKDAKGGKS
jgi:large subunit ribosomal protein L25